jgi:hypothetical protein
MIYAHLPITLQLSLLILLKVLKIFPQGPPGPCGPRGEIIVLFPAQGAPLEGKPAPGGDDNSIEQLPCGELFVVPFGDDERNINCNLLANYFYYYLNKV